MGKNNGAELSPARTALFKLRLFAEYGEIDFTAGDAQLVVEVLTGLSKRIDQAKATESAAVKFIIMCDRNNVPAYDWAMSDGFNRLCAAIGANDADLQTVRNADPDYQNCQRHGYYSGRST